MTGFSVCADHPRVLLYQEATQRAEVCQTSSLRGECADDQTLHPKGNLGKTGNPTGTLQKASDTEETR